MDENKSAEVETAEAEPEKEVVHCKKCGAVLDGNFCSQCGAPVSDQPHVFCPNCGGEVVDMVCTSCGKKYKRIISIKRFIAIYLLALLIPSMVICLFTQGTNEYTLIANCFSTILLISAFYAIGSLLWIAIASISKKGKRLPLNILILSCPSFLISAILFWATSH